MTNILKVVAENVEAYIGLTNSRPEQILVIPDCSHKRYCVHYLTETVSPILRNIESPSEEIPPADVNTEIIVLNSYEYPTGARSLIGISVQLGAILCTSAIAPVVGMYLKMDTKDLEYPEEKE